MSTRDTLDFLLHDWLKVDQLCERERFADHSRATFDAVLDTCERLARDKFAPFNRLLDTEEPRFENGRVRLPQATHDALHAYSATGMIAASQDVEIGGMQLPCVVEKAANAFFSQACIAMGGYVMLTHGNAGLLMAHGSERQQRVFAAREFSGEWFGTMCLSEPQAGSSLSDIATRATPDGAGFESDPLGARYKLVGNKMWISAGEHEITPNIVHLVLAKIPGPDGRLPAGVKGISLFIVPKHQVDAEGRLTGIRNDVSLAGLNHKLGYRGTTNTLLNFGEKGGATGYLVGRPGEGLRCMFHMMNEARIGVGLGATMLGAAGYEASLAYAKQRTQGRPSTARPPEGAHPAARSAEAPGVSAGGKDASAPPVRLIEHADIRRMLLAQKAYVEGGMALALYCARLVDEQRTGTPESATEAGTLLEMLTPIAKSWPSEWALEANSLAIQIHGGYGYTRDFPVEQHWRDNRLNMIHEGTHGIQALDLLGRKAVMQGGAGLKLLARRIDATIARALAQARLAAHANTLAQALQRLGAATRSAWATANPEDALANATPYLQAFGHTILAWLWLDVGVSILESGDAEAAADVGRLAALDYFMRYELPKADAWLRVVESRDRTCRDVPEDAF
jgi:alkylation response protein AidB-like acyl-CoA dehydrogenase